MVAMFADILGKTVHEVGAKVEEMPYRHAKNVEIRTTECWPAVILNIVITLGVILGKKFVRSEPRSRRYCICKQPVKPCVWHFMTECPPCRHACQSHIGL